MSRKQNNIEALIKNAGFSNLLPIQQKVLEASESHKDIVLHSRTGSGKTLAFLLSIYSKLSRDKNDIQALVLCPTRELCLQIESVFKSLKTDFKISTCYGGHSMKTEFNNLQETPAVLLGTPGRISDHIRRENILLENCSFIVLDEYDKCIEYGFDKEMAFIYDHLKSIQYHLLVSATNSNNYPSYITLPNPLIIDNITKEPEPIGLEEVLVEYNSNIFDTLFSLLTSLNNEKAIVFCNYREVVEDLTFKLNEINFSVTSYHGGLDQDERERAIIKFRNNTATILVCTDLGARGLDIPEVKHIVHFQYPSSLEAFVHRKGRTARMNETGTSYLLKGSETSMPYYLVEPQKKLSLPKSNEAVQKSIWETVYFSGGKKEKINKIDIVGFLSKIGELKQGDIGIIDVLDHSSYVAIRKSKLKELLPKIKNEKVKGKKLKIAIAR